MVHPLLERVRAGRPGYRLLEVAEGVRPAPDGHVARPARVQAEVEGLDDPARQPLGSRHAVAHLPIAGAYNREVDGEHQHGTADAGGTGHQVLGVGPVAHDVELEPERRGGGTVDLLDAADGHGRLAEGDAHLLSSLGRLHLGARGVHAGQTDRPEYERHGQGLAQHGGGQLQLGHVPQHALAQVDGGEVVFVGPQRRLLVGAAVDVIEQLAGEPPPGQFAVVADRGRSQAQRAIGEQRHRGRR